MSSVKYIGLDVHQATTVAAVLDGSGKLIMEAIVETKASTILEFIGGIRGELNITLEEGTRATWLHDLLEPHRSSMSLSRGGARSSMRPSTGGRR